MIFMNMKKHLTKNYLTKVNIYTSNDRTISRDVAEDFFNKCEPHMTGRYKYQSKNNLVLEIVNNE